MSVPVCCHDFKACALAYNQTPAGFGGDFLASRPVVGGAHTKMRMDSMEKFFGSQGLASPLEAPGEP